MPHNFAKITLGDLIAISLMIIDRRSYAFFACQRD